MFKWRFVLLCFVFASAYVQAKDVETESTTQKTPELKTRFFGLENILGQIFQGPNNPGFGGNFQQSPEYYNQQNPQAQHNWQNIQTPNYAQSNLDQSLQSTPLYPQGNFNSQNNFVPGANQNVQTQQFPNQQQIFNQQSNMDQYPHQSVTQGNFNAGNINPDLNTGTIDNIPSQNGNNGNWNQRPGNQFHNQNVENHQFGMPNQNGNQGFQNPNVGNQNAGNQFGMQNQNGNQGFQNPNVGNQNAGNQFGMQNQNGNQGFQNPNVGNQNAGKQFGMQNQNGNQGFQSPNVGNQNAGNQFGMQNQNGNQGFQSPNVGNQNAGNQFGMQNQNGNRGIQNQSPRDDDYNPVAILGKPVPVTTSNPDSIVFTDGCDTPTQKQCVQDCQSTSEYNPVCGSNNVTYFNPGRFICARNCRINVFVQRAGRC